MSVWKSEDMSTYLKNKLLRRTGGMDLPPTGRQQRSRSLDVEALQRSGVQVILQVIMVFNDKTFSSFPFLLIFFNNSRSMMFFEQKKKHYF